MECNHTQRFWWCCKENNTKTCQTFMIHCVQSKKKTKKKHEIYNYNQEQKIYLKSRKLLRKTCDDKL